MKHKFLNDLKSHIMLQKWIFFSIVRRYFFRSPLQCSCLENPRDRGAWWAAVYGVTQSRTQLKRLSSSSSSNLTKGFPDSSVGKESACNAEDHNLIPGSGRSPGEGIGYPLQYFWASLVAQLVKNLPAM